MEIVAGVPIQQHVAWKRNYILFKLEIIHNLKLKLTQHPDTGTEVEYLEWFLPTFSFQQVVYMHLQQVWEAQSRTELSSRRRSLDFDFATWPQN